MNIDTITREEQYLNRLAGETDQTIPEPETRKEQYLSRLCGADNIIPQNPITREEQFLASLCGEEIEMPEPETRLEQFMAFAGSQRENKPEPITRKEQLWDKYQGGAVPEEKTVTGNPIHITDAVEESALALSVSFEPTQEATPFVGDTTTEPYLSKTASTTGNKRYLDKIIGGTVAWNQLEPLDASKYTKTNITLSLSNGEYTFTPTTSTSVPKYAGMELTVGHVYFVSGKIGSSSDTTRSRAGIINATETNIISINGQGEYRSGAFIHKLATNEIFALRVNNAITISESGYAKDLQIIDLTLMFGSTIADYIYSLEQVETGAGVQWLKDYGFIDDNYRAYNPGELISCRPEGIQYGSTTAMFGSPVELKGFYKLDANNKLYCDGDELTPDGALTERYLYREMSSSTNWVATTTADGDFAVAVRISVLRTNQTKDLFMCSEIPKDGNKINSIYNLYTEYYNLRISKSGITSVQEWKDYLDERNAQGKPITWIRYAGDTPATSTSESYPNPVDIANGDTESFIDTRAIPLPVGNNSHYAGEYAVQGKTGLTVKHAQTQEDTPTTYSVTFTEQGTVYGGVIDIVTGVLTITWGHIASYNGETLTGEWLSDRDVYSAGATPTTGAEVAYELASPITAELTPQQVDMLLGENTVWTENGENMELTYKARAAQRVLAMNRKLNLNKQALEIKKNGGVIIDKPIIKPIDKGGLKL